MYWPMQTTRTTFQLFFRNTHSCIGKRGNKQKGKLEASLSPPRGVPLDIVPRIKPSESSETWAKTQIYRYERNSPLYPALTNIDVCRIHSNNTLAKTEKELLIQSNTFGHPLEVFLWSVFLHDRYFSTTRDPSRSLLTARQTKKQREETSSESTASGV